VSAHRNPDSDRARRQKHVQVQVISVTFTSRITKFFYEFRFPLKFYNAESLHKLLWINRFSIAYKRTASYLSCLAIYKLLSD